MDDGFFRRRFGGLNDDFDSMFRRNINPSIDQFGSFVINDFNKIFQEMDEVMRRFGHGNFSMIEGPDNSQIPSIEGPQNSKQNLRDHFLKEESPEKEKNSSSFIFPGKPHSFVDRFLQTNNSKFDEDLDIKIEREGLDKVVREDLLRNDRSITFNNPIDAPRFFGTGQACSIRRIQRPDGSIEEVKTIKSMDGKEEKTVTRIIGDKAHSVIEKKANNQLQETEEIFHNFDQDKIDDFNRMWNNFSTKNENNKQKKSILGKENETKFANTENKIEKNPSFFSKLFSWFKK